MPDVLVLGGATGEELDTSVPDQIAYGTPHFAARGYTCLRAPVSRWPRLHRMVRVVRPPVLRLYLALVLGQLEALGSMRRADLVDVFDAVLHR